MWHFFYCVYFTTGKFNEQVEIFIYLSPVLYVIMTVWKGVRPVVSRKKNQPKKKVGTGKGIFIAVVLFISFGFGLTIGAGAYIISDTPNVSAYGDWQSTETTRIYNADGELIHRLFRENREYVTLNQIPEKLQQAVLAMEDSRFFKHSGIDYRGIARAIWVDIQEGGYAQGASTITMQLARNVYLTQEKFIYRKIQEMFLALQFERIYTKEEILEFYLNEIFWGHSAYGIQTAAHQYFGKDVWDLDLSEIAMLVGILQAPNRHSPYFNMDQAKFRQQVTLNRMLELDLVSPEEAEKAAEAPLELVGLGQTQDEFGPYFMRYVRDELLKMFGPQVVYGGGLRVYTTLDNRMQEQAEKTVKEMLEDETLPTIQRANLPGDPNQPQLAILSIDPKTGHIKAMVGGRGDDQWNRATQSRRQAGSAFKPIIYSAAVKEGLSPGSVVLDYPTVEYSGHTVTSTDDQPTPWPRNFNDVYRGWVTLREAMNHSINVAAVKTLSEIGVSNALRMAQDLGIKNLVPEDRNLGLALGGLTRGITPLEMAQAFGVFANRGIRTEPVAILKVEDNRGNVLYEANPTREIAISEGASYIITDMLQSVIKDGTGWRAELGRPTAGKTGTTNDYTDAWFVGYTPDLVTAVWVGEDSPRPMKYFPQTDSSGNVVINPRTNEPNYGVTLSSWIAAELWGRYMRAAVEPMPVTKFPPRPRNVIEVSIDPFTGKLPGSYAPREVTELFIRGTEPEERESFHQPIERVDVDVETGLLATPDCPQENVQTRRYQMDTSIRVDDNGLPIHRFDPSTGVPLTDEEGNYIFEKKPTQSCFVHGSTRPAEEAPSEDDDDTIDRLWDRLWDRSDD